MEDTTSTTSEDKRGSNDEATGRGASDWTCGPSAAPHPSITTNDQRHSFPSYDLQSFSHFRPSCSDLARRRELVPDSESATGDLLFAALARPNTSNSTLHGITTAERASVGSLMKKKFIRKHGFRQGFCVAANVREHVSVDLRAERSRSS